MRYDRRPHPRRGVQSDSPQRLRRLNNEYTYFCPHRHAHWFHPFQSSAREQRAITRNLRGVTTTGPATISLLADTATLASCRKKGHANSACKDAGTAAEPEFSTKVNTRDILVVSSGNTLSRPRTSAHLCLSCARCHLGAPGHPFRLPPSCLSHLSPSVVISPVVNIKYSFH